LRDGRVGVHGAYRVRPAFRRTLLPLTTGHASYRCVLRRRCRVRALQPARRNASRGGKTRSKSWFVGLRHRPPRPWTLTRPGPRGTLDRSASLHFHEGVRDPPDLRAGFPDTSRSLRPGTEMPDFLSWGCPKISPPSTSAKESTPRRFRALRGRLPHPPAFRPRGFTPPRRFAPLPLCRLVSSCCRPWGSLRFRRLRNRLPRCAFPPFEAFPPPTAHPVSPPRLPSRPFRCALA